MVSQLTDIVLFITGFQLLLLSVVILRQKSNHRTNRFLLVAFLLTKEFLILRWLFFRFLLIPYGDYPYLYYLTVSAFFLLAPWVYLYIRSLCYRDFALKGIDLLHALPFVAILLMSFVSVQLRLVPGGHAGVRGILVDNYWDLFWTLNFIQIFFYIMAMIQTVRVYRHKLRNLYSSVDRINLNWLLALLAVISLHWCFVVSRGILAILDVEAGAAIPLLDLFSISIFLVFTTLLVLKGLHQLKVFSGIEEKGKNGGVKLPENEAQKIMQRLTAYMRREKPYLEPSLTIDELSERVSIPSWHLSYVINKHFNQNFFNFVNAYRIQEAKDILQHPADYKKTILEIIYEVGFNSKSTFNEVFKKYTGMTPSQYKSVKLH